MYIGYEIKFLSRGDIIMSNDEMIRLYKEEKEVPMFIWLKAKEEDPEITLDEIMEILGAGYR